MADSFQAGWAVDPATGAARIDDLAAAAVPADARFIAGAAYSQDGKRYGSALAVDAPAPAGAIYIGGIAHRPDGAVYFTDGLPASRLHHSGWLLQKDGVLAINTGSPTPLFYHGGLAFDSGGRLKATVT